MALILKGGRLTKFKGRVASFAPHLGAVSGSVSSAALATGLLFGSALVNTPALAGTCSVGPNSVCSGVANPAIDTGQTITGTNLDVTTTPGFGLSVPSGNGIIVNGSGGTVFTDNYNSAIEASGGGLTVINSSAGAASVFSTGSIVSTGSSTGLTVVNVNNVASNADLTIDAVDVSGGAGAIVAVNNGSGVMNIAVTGTLTAPTDIGGSGDGLLANNNGSTTTVAVVDVDGNNRGVAVSHYGTGAATVTATGSVVGRGSEGIAAKNSYGTDLTVNAADTTGATTGISAQNGGTGALTVTSTGTATGSGGDGIYAHLAGIVPPPYYYGRGVVLNGVPAASGTDLTVTANNSVGGANGINARSNGSGVLSVTSTGGATGAENDGIFASNTSYGTELTVTSRDTAGGQNGIEARNYGSGALSVTSTGTATGTNRSGIYASNLGTSLTVDANDANGGQDGILARNDGSGALTVVSTGTATGTNGDGINASNSSNGTDLMITAVNSTGGIDGIAANNAGTGALTVVSTGTANGASGNGITARNQTQYLPRVAGIGVLGGYGVGAAGTDLTVTAATSIGGNDGIYASSAGTGAVSITSGTATGTNGDGIFARTLAGGTDLTITANDSTGGVHGINANNYGSGAVVVNSTGAATGGARDGIYAYNLGTSLTVAANSSTGGANGLDIENHGTGALSITSTATATGNSGDGIFAENSSNGTDLTIAATDTVGGTNGLYTNNYGTGALTVTSTGTATGTSENGIYAYNAGTSLTVSANNSTGGVSGLDVENKGTGALTVTSTGTAIGANRNGIYAYNSASGTDLTVKASDSAGYRNGIEANNYGTGALTITSTGTATGASENGIRAYNAGTNLTVDANNSAGYTNGIAANNVGTGALTVVSTGTATGTYGDGISASNSPNGTDLMITANNSTGGVDGIAANNAGTGALTVISTGTATGTSGDGITARNQGQDLTRVATFAGYSFGGSGTDLTVVAATSIGGNDGIYASNAGTGVLSITSGTATGTNGDGIDARNSSNGTDLTITANDSTGGEYGILAKNDGIGALTIVSTGTATGLLYGDGIDAENTSSGTNLTVIANNTAGARNGIDADNYGTGTITVTSTGTATGTTRNGIYAYNSANGTDLTVKANDSTGYRNGLQATNYGTGALTVTSTGTATGTNRNGIYAYNEGTNLTVDANGSTGYTNGILAVNHGTGVLTVVSTGTAAGTSGNGITATNSPAGTDLMITANNSTGGVDGIAAKNAGTGALTVVSTGTATGTSGNGITARNYAQDLTRVAVSAVYGVGALGTDLTVIAATSIGGNDGIYASNAGTGVLSITSGTATGTNGDGIYAGNTANGTDLKITANDTTGGVNGINANSYGTGALTLTSIGTATGNVDGIRASNSANGTDLALAAHDSTGGEYGILARNDGIGALTIISTGTATGGVYGDGIDAENSSNGTALTVTANNSTGGANGVFATNNGSGALSVTSTGTATGGPDGSGIVAQNYNGTDLTVAANNTAGGDGIVALNYGTGALSVTSTGTATGTDFAGIEAYNSANGTALTVKANDSSGARNGIDANNYGSGALTITSTGAATGATGDGIYAYNRGANLTVDANNSAGYGNGIAANNAGTGALTVVSTGTATGTVGDGINASNAPGGTDLVITANNSTGGVDGIAANNAGTGALTVISTGTATGTTGNGITATNSASGTNLTITANNSTGGIDGIAASNAGTGALTVVSTGTATGNSGDGITARLDAITPVPAFARRASLVYAAVVSGTDLTITANNSIGGVNGISAVNNGTGLLTVNASGAVTGGTGAGIATSTPAGNLTVINLASTAVVGAQSGIAITNNEGDSNTFEAAGAVINGQVLLGDGSDSITFAGANALAGVTLVDGGDDATVADGYIDTLTLSGVNAVIAPGLIQNFEQLVLTGGSVIQDLVRPEVTVCGTPGGTLGSGTVVNSVLGCASDDAITVTDNASIGSIEGAGGSDTISVLGAASVGSVYGGNPGADDSAATDAGDVITIATTGAVELVDGGAGNDTINLGSGAVGTVLGGTGSDTVNVASTFNLSGVVLNGGGDAIGTAGDNDQLNLNNWSGALVSADIQNFENVNINGGTVSLADRTIAAGSLNVVGGTFDARNSPTVPGNFGNAGTVLLAGANVGNTLTVRGNYTGTEGKLVINTVLGGGSATDLLIIGGNASGRTLTTINNIGGLGVKTTGDGIRIVQVDGTSSAGAFVLAGPVNAGALGYQLYQGGVSDPNDQDFYLRSQIRSIVQPTIALARIAQDVGMTMLGTLHDRVGEQENLSAQGATSGMLTGMWGRMIGKDYTDRSRSSTFGNGRSTGQIGGLQMGLDLYRGISGDSQTHIGVYGGHVWGGSTEYARGTATPYAGGTKTDGWIAGGYATHYGKGWYADLAVQRTFLKLRANDNEGTVLRTKGHSWMASLELGAPLNVGSGFVFEPEAQVIYGSTDLNDSADTSLILNHFDVKDSTTGRLGFRLKRTWNYDSNSAAGLWTPYIKANVWSRLSGGDTKLTVTGSAPGVVSYGKTWVDVGGGTTYSLSAKADLFIDAAAQFGVSQRGTSAITGHAGFRMRF